MMRSRLTRGFTLLEMLVTLAVVGGIMAAIYGVLFGTLQNKREIEFHVAGAKVGPLILDQVEKDIRQLYLSDIDHTKAFVGVDHYSSGRDADKIHFVSQTPSTQRVVDRDKYVFSAVNEIGYVVTDNPANPDFMILWRREDFFVDEEPLEDGYGVPLYRRVLAFNIRYFDVRGKEAEDEEKWDLEDRKKLPAAIEITLDYEVEPRDRGTSFTSEELLHRRFRARRFITFADDLGATLAARPAVPIVTEDTGSGPKGKGKDEEEGGANVGEGGSAGGGGHTGQTGGGGGGLKLPGGGG